MISNGKNINRQIACLLRTKRINSRLPQEKAAEQFGIDPKTWRRYETGESTIPADVLFRFFPELEKILADHISERSCSGACEKCEKKHRRVERSWNVGQCQYFGPKEDREQSKFSKKP